MKTLKSLEQALKDGNNESNQRIKERFVGQHVYCNVNMIVEYCLQKGYEDPRSPIQPDEIENMYSYPEYRGTYTNFDGGTDEQRQEEIERLTELHEGEENEEISQAISDELHELENLESEPQEVYEWWAVSEFLHRKLKEMGHPVVDAGSFYVWGRCTTGQAILLDYAITKVCADMGILEGQESSWAGAD